MGGLFSWLQRTFWAQEMEMAVLGLGHAGKSTFVNVVSTGEFSENLAPTIGFNMQKVTRGRVVIKVWDMGGQEKFRGMWEKYCRGVDVVLFMVDSADNKLFETAKNELHSLMNNVTLSGVPLLILLNKNDVAKTSPEDIIMQLDLQSLSVGRSVAYYSISCKNLNNIDKTLEWIIQHANSKKN